MLFRSYFVYARVGCFDSIFICICFLASQSLLPDYQRLSHRLNSSKLIENSVELLNFIVFNNFGETLVLVTCYMMCLVSGDYVKFCTYFDEIRYEFLYPALLFCFWHNVASWIFFSLPFFFLLL